MFHVCRNPQTLEQELHYLLCSHSQQPATSLIDQTTTSHALVSILPRNLASAIHFHETDRLTSSVPSHIEDFLCSSPLHISYSLANALPIDAFLSTHFQEINDFSLTIRLRSDDLPVAPERIGLVALYPSGQVRSVGATFSLTGGFIQATIYDLTFFFDPNGSPLSESITGNVTLVAVSMEG
jgi:hypothetical protein